MIAHAPQLGRARERHQRVRLAVIASSNARAPAATRCAAHRGGCAFARSIFSNAPNALVRVFVRRGLGLEFRQELGVLGGHGALLGGLDAVGRGRGTRASARRRRGRIGPHRCPGGRGGRPDAVPRLSPARSIERRGSAARARPQRAESASSRDGRRRLELTVDYIARSAETAGHSCASTGCTPTARAAACGARVHAREQRGRTSARARRSDWSAAGNSRNRFSHHGGVLPRSSIAIRWIRT